ncbi:MAG: hypothetical protein ACJAXJ_004398, partial [Colwellia sp.]
RYHGCLVNLVLYFLYFFKIKSTLRAIVLMVFDLNPFKPVTFSSSAKNKVTKKKPLANYVLHPIIFDI